MTYIWGLTRKANIVHAFRNSRAICPSKAGAHSWLFLPKPDWNPDHPLTCPACKILLEFERKAQLAQIAVSSISPTS